MERTFENKIKRINYNVYKAIVTYSYKGKLSDIYRDAPQEILPGPQAEIRCCIYKERAILSERFKLAMCDESDRKTVKIIDRMRRMPVIRYRNRFELQKLYYA